MKKYTLFLFVVILILVMLFASSAQAGKPKPTAYPPPDIKFEAQAYPTPDPSFPFPGEPPPDAPYVWGLYLYGTSYRWYVSKYTSVPDETANILLCVADGDPYYQYCYRHAQYSESLEYIGYQDGMSWYQSIPFQHCGWYGAIPDNSNWNGQSFVLHQPNWYYVPCTVWENPIYLPFVRKP